MPTSKATYECSCQRCGHVWRTSEQGLQRPCPQCGSTTFLYQEVTRANIRAAKREDGTSRWPLRFDIAIGSLMAWGVVVVVSALALVAVALWADDAFEAATEPEGDWPANVLEDESTGDLPACADVFAEGRPTADVLADNDAGPCTDSDGNVQVYVTAFQQCSDGRTLHWNDAGWGYEDGTWTPDASGLPPQAEQNACA